MTNQVLFANNDQTTLASSLSNSATTATLIAGSSFPSPSAGQFFTLTFISATNPAIYEITYCTARSGNTVTITRAQEGTTALAFNAGDIAANVLTAGSLALLPQIGQANTWTGANTFNDPITIADASASNQAVALGQISGPGIATAYGGGTNTTVTVSVSFTAPAPGVLIAIGAINKATQEGGASAATLYINGTQVDSDNNELPNTNMGAIGCTAGAVSASYTSASTTLFTCRVMLIYIPNV